MLLLVAERSFRQLFIPTGMLPWLLPDLGECAFVLATDNISGKQTRIGYV